MTAHATLVVFFTGSGPQCVLVEGAMAHPLTIRMAQQKYAKEAVYGGCWYANVDAAITSPAFQRLPERARAAVEAVFFASTDRIQQQAALVENTVRR